MAEVLSIPGVLTPWMAHQKDYLPTSPDLISVNPSGLPESWEDLDKHLSHSLTDWFSLFNLSKANSKLHSPLPHYLSPTTSALHRPRPFSGNMLNQHRLTEHPMSSREERYCMPLRREDPRSTAYAQSVSPFMARPDINGALSSNGSTYCESGLGSLEPFDEPFTTRTVETHTGLVHPTPKSSVLMAANNLSFLASAEEISPLSSFGPSGSPINSQPFSGDPSQISNTPNYDMSASYLHPRNSPLPLSATPQDAKALAYDHTTPWPIWKTEPTTDMWYPTHDFNNTPDTSAWHNQNQYSAPWNPVNNTYTRPEEFNESTTYPYTINNAPMFPSGLPPISPPSSLPMMHQSYPPTPAPNVASLEASPSYPLAPQSMYLPSTHAIYLDTSFSSPPQKQTSLSPSSLSPPTSSEGPSPQKSSEDRGIEASLHYSDERNAFLIDCKRRGLSYKDIKRVGGFKEAESTLRGRYRTLTKSKDQRVRKPKWQDKDVSGCIIYIIPIYRLECKLICFGNRSDSSAKLLPTTPKHKVHTTPSLWWV
jgi:hypothetical protein